MTLSFLSELARALIFAVFLALALAAMLHLLSFGVEAAGGLLALALLLPLLVGYHAQSWKVKTWAGMGVLTLVLWIGVTLATYRGQEWGTIAHILQSSAPLVLGYIAVAGGALWAGQFLSQQVHAHPQVRRAFSLALLMMAVGVLVFGIYLRNLGLLPFARGHRLDAYDRLWIALERFYSHWETSPVTPQELKARYRPRILAAVQACEGQPGPCAPYQKALRDMLAELQDGHTRFSPIPQVARPPVAVREVEGQAVVVWVAPDSEAERLGLRPGDVIVDVEGVPVSEAVRRVPRWMVAYTAPHTRVYQAYAHLLVGPPGTTVTFTVENEHGQRRSVTLKRGGFPISGWAPVEGRRLDGNLGYIAVHTLARGPELVATFDAVLDGMMDARGLIIDLRSNGGGNSSLGDQMVGRLITTTLPYGEECFRAPHPMHLWISGCHTLAAKPRGKPYTGPVAVLINTDVHSSGEWMVAALCTTGRARCFGRVTAGNSGNPVPFYVPDGVVYFSTGNFRLLDGTPLNGRGIQPHVPIEITIADVRAGRDPDLEAATEWLLSSGRRTP